MLSDAKEPITYLITSGKATDENFSEAASDILALVAIAVREGVSLIQLREKQLSGRRLFELASACVNVVKNTRSKLLINDRGDIAVAARADGVHLTEVSIPISVAREVFGKGLLIGVSVHTPEGARSAAADGADFAVYGPIFETPGKGSAVGLEALADVCSEVAPFPVLGIGGIDGANCRSVIASGAAGVAAIRGMEDAESIRFMMRELRNDRND